MLPFSLSPSFPAFAGFLLYAARANIRRRVERENLERNARSKRISLGIYEVRELRRDVRTSCATHACSNFNRTWSASEISPSILYPASFFTRYRLLQNSRDRIKFNDRVLNVLRGTAEFQINCLGLHGNDRTRTRDRRLLESLAAVDVALSEVVSSRGKSFFFFFPFFFFSNGPEIYTRRKRERGRFYRNGCARWSRSLVSLSATGSWIPRWPD